MWFSWIIDTDMESCHGGVVTVDSFTHISIHRPRQDHITLFACCVTLGALWLVHTSVVPHSDWSTSAGTQHNFLSQTGRCHPGFSFLKALYLHTDFWIYSEVSRVEEVRGLGEPQNYLLLQITRFTKLLNTFRIHYHEEFLLPLAGSSAAGILFPS